MAVAIIRTDNWLVHLPFSGPRRPTTWGPVDGIFYGVLSGVGDSGGGNFTLNGLVSFDRKEDWIYVLQGVASQRNDVLAGESAFVIANTGPLIPTDSAVQNPSFPVGYVGNDIINNAVTILGENHAQTHDFKDLPIFGDKRLPGSLALLACGWETNTDTVTYTTSVWGWLVRYQSFFRNLPPAMG